VGNDILVYGAASSRFLFLLSPTTRSPKFMVNNAFRTGKSTLPSVPERLSAHASGSPSTRNKRGQPECRIIDKIVLQVRRAAASNESSPWSTPHALPD